MYRLLQLLLIAAALLAVASVNAAESLRGGRELTTPMNCLSVPKQLYPKTGAASISCDQQCTTYCAGACSPPRAH